jgi:hypothetical protein
MAVITYLGKGALAKGIDERETDLLRFYKARADKAERENQVAAGELVNVKDLNKRLANAFAALRQKIMQSSASKRIQDELIRELAEVKKNFPSSDMPWKSSKSRSA